MNAETNRADPFGDMDLTSFEPQSSAPKKAPIEKTAIRQVSEANNFPSRAAAKVEAAAVGAPPLPASPQAVPARAMRRHRTGRNVQFNIKTTSGVIERFLAVSDREEWVLGETLEKALDALEMSLEKGQHRP